MVLSVGEILFDNFPEYRRLGGAPFNFAFHMRGLGFDARFASRIGNDDRGREVLAFLHEKNFSDELVQIDPLRPTGEVNITLGPDGAADFTILPDAAYDFIEDDDTLVRALKGADLFYFGTLIQRAEGAGTIQRLLDICPEKTITVYDVNLRRDCYDEPVIRFSLQHSDVVKLNDDELEVLRDMICPRSGEHDFLHYLMEQYSISMISLTRGPRGSALLTATEHAEAPPVHDITIVDTVGAGDGYTAVLAAGCLMEWEPQEIVETAAEFAARICEIEGALPRDDLFYTPFRDRFHGGTA